MIREHDNPTAAQTVRCLIVDDHAAVRAGVRELLSAEPRLEVVAEAATAERGLAYAEHDRVDVAIVDYHLSGHSGLWLARRLRMLVDGPAVVVYSAFSDALLAAGCVIAGADGLVSKASLGEELAETVAAVVAGERRLPPPLPVLAESLLSQLDPGDQAIYEMMAVGVAPDEVAQSLRLSPAEVDVRVWAMLDTLDRDDRLP